MQLEVEKNCTLPAVRLEPVLWRLRGTDPGAPSLAVCTGASGSHSALSFLICKIGVDNGSYAGEPNDVSPAWPLGQVQ